METKQPILEGCSERKLGVFKVLLWYLPRDETPFYQGTLGSERFTGIERVFKTLSALSGICMGSDGAGKLNTDFLVLSELGAVVL